MVADPPKGSVLIVDDDPQLRKLLQTWLESTHDVHTAADGTEALEIISPAIDVVLLDRNLGDLTGSGVLKEIRERELHCKVSMLTAVAPQREILEMPFDEYLVKPVDQQELQRTVDELLARSEYISLMDHYFELTTKLSVIEQSPEAAEIKTSSAYDDLVTKHEKIVDELTHRRSTLMESDTYDKLFTDVEAI